MVAAYVKHIHVYVHMYMRWLVYVYKYYIPIVFVCQCASGVQLMASELVNEPDWFYGTLKGVPSPKVTYSSDYPIQEDDRLKPFLYDISEYGLNYAYRKYEVNQPDDEYKHTQTNRPKNVIIVGAGMSGLVAGYELAQVGHEVQILELQHRVGGRIKTVSDEKFFPGQWADGT